MTPIEEIGTFAAFGAFVGALAAYLWMRVEEAADWAMHGMVGGGIIGMLSVVFRSLP